MAKISHLSDFEMPTNTDVNYEAKCKHCGSSILGFPKYLFVDYNILYTACIIIILLYTTFEK